MPVVFPLFIAGLLGWLSPTLPAPRRAFVYPASPTTKATFSNDGRLVLVGTQAGQIALFHGRTALLVREFAGHRKPISDLESWPDRDTVVSGDAGGNLLFWRTSDLTVLRRSHVSAPVKLVRVQPGKPQVAVAGRRMVWLVNTSGDSRRLLLPGLTGSDITAMAFSPDGAKLAVGYANGQLVVSDLATGQQQRVRQKTAIRDLAFGRDTLLTVSGDPVLTMWCHPGRNWVLTHSLPTAYPLTAVGKMGSTVALGSANGDVIVLTPGQENTQVVGHNPEPVSSVQKHPREALLLTTTASEPPKTWRLNE
ncbi:WD40 repeat domain-containing protein [Spirosoma rhododendri]|uniref:WD40 repeat domain-containing protein n=1 Tax=Spirosoma rhododendri TaxID=2728024 RepID=A0A7L5DNI6_9BACT|nr:hypothetical protein [Spirosoma rhododendri]QJD80044.1 hypothetical protein HH216_17705 [Spirosoma rhododendri]